MTRKLSDEDFLILGDRSWVKIMIKQTCFVIFLFVFGCLADACRPVATPIYNTTSVPASCLDASGTNRCGLAPRWNRTSAALSHNNLLGASSGGDRAAVIPPSWAVSTWGVDGTNVSTCASDNNNCTQTTCGAAGSFQGPCSTYGEIAQRWGTYYPRLRQVTTITALSAFSSTDTMYLNALVEGAGNTLNLVCALGATQQVWTGTLGTVTAKNRTANQRLNAVISSGLVAQDQLLINTTHASYAWVTSNVSGTTWSISQPSTGCSSASSCTPTEVDTWAMGDSVTAYTPSNVYLAQALPGGTDAPAAIGSTPTVWINGCNVAASGSANTSVFVGNQYVQLVNTSISRLVQDGIGSQASVVGGSISPQFVNADITGYFRGIGAYLFAGRIGYGSHFIAMQGAALTGDVEIFDQLFVSGSSVEGPEGASTFNNVYIGTGLTVVGGYATITGPIWGGGYVGVSAGGFLQYPSGVGAAVANFLQTGSMDVNASTTACSNSSGAITCGISVTPAYLDAAAGFAGFGGNAFALGGGQISNVLQ